VKIRDAKLAILDTTVIHDLAKRPRIAAERLDTLHRDGLVTAITQRIWAEIIATPNPAKRRLLLETVMSRVDVYLPFEALDLVKLELQEKDPAAVIGDKTLLSARIIETLDCTKEQVEAFSAANREQDARVKVLAPQSDPKLKTLIGLATFAEHVEVLETEVARGFLEFINRHRPLGAVDLHPAALSALVKRGRSLRMSVLMILAYGYHRATARLKRKTPKPGGALTDAPILGAAAYSQVVLTTDKVFVACGELVNRVVAEPEIRLWEPT
jgi:hypothetical protein